MPFHPAHNRPLSRGTHFQVVSKQQLVWCRVWLTSLTSQTLTWARLSSLHENLHGHETITRLIITRNVQVGLTHQEPRYKASWTPLKLVSPATIKYLQNDREQRLTFQTSYLNTPYSMYILVNGSNYCLLTLYSSSLATKDIKF